MKHEIPYLLYFQVLFWASAFGCVVYTISLSGLRDYPHTETRNRWEDMLRLFSNAAGALILYRLCWGQW